MKIILSQTFHDLCMLKKIWVLGHLEPYLEQDQVEYVWFKAGVVAVSSLLRMVQHSSGAVGGEIV